MGINVPACMGDLPVSLADITPLRARDVFGYMCRNTMKKNYRETKDGTRKK